MKNTTKNKTKNTNRSKTAHIILTKGYTTIVDAKHFDVINSEKWQWVNGYANRKQWNPQTKRQEPIIMARFIYETFVEPIPEGMYIDHINGDPLDNRLCNLRPVTPQQNKWNARVSKSSRTGYKGVSYNKKTNMFEAYIYTPKKKHLGYYPTALKAYKVYCKAALELQGPYAKLK